MKLSILTIIIASLAFSSTQAEYKVFLPLEHDNGGSLPTNSIVFNGGKPSVGITEPVTPDDVQLADETITEDAKEECSKYYNDFMSSLPNHQLAGMPITSSYAIAGKPFMAVRDTTFYENGEFIVSPTETCIVPLDIVRGGPLCSDTEVDDAGIALNNIYYNSLANANQLYGFSLDYNFTGYCSTVTPRAVTDNIKAKAIAYFLNQKRDVIIPVSFSGDYSEFSFVNSSSYTKSDIQFFKDLIQSENNGQFNIKFKD
ncbi:hypothetical protein EJ576_21965 [Pseudomonas sp. C 49-2]|uniref:hypothetical protein n=1 Tax=Pseudomonas sp. C 49-2 TaxID=2496849 RepID=UPI000F8393EF|nr:hypothetical protein [Pseudomonas sp. C 49-2]RTX96395.1 hypothetical protein EJ576_21965 [Pseudomonas sp. C 49-2]